MSDLNASYWSKRWAEGQTGWDAGEITPPIKAYADGLNDKSIRILIPGCGSGYEGAYLWKNGFQHLYLSDISELPLKKFANSHPGFPEQNLLHGNFFDLQGKFDLVLEQTFFCALHPTLRPAYVKKMKDLLSPTGKLAGLFFDVEFENPGPPFGGSQPEYRKLFSNDFEILRMSKCTNSIAPRLGSEVFFEMIRK